MAQITRELLSAYLDDSLSDAETAEVERALRESAEVTGQLRALMQDRDRGEHSVGAVWRRERISCPSREQLGTYLLQVLDDGLQDYVDFHLKVIGCAYCQANLADLENLRKENEPGTRARRKRFFDSSAGFLQARRPSC
jgi:hypothetical protein